MNPLIDLRDSSAGGGVSHDDDIQTIPSIAPINFTAAGIFVCQTIPTGEQTTRFTFTNSEVPGSTITVKYIWGFRERFDNYPKVLGTGKPLDDVPPKLKSGWQRGPYTLMKYRRGDRVLPDLFPVHQIKGVHDRVLPQTFIRRVVEADNALYILSQNPVDLPIRIGGIGDSTLGDLLHPFVGWLHGNSPNEGAPYFECIQALHARAGAKTSQLLQYILNADFKNANCVIIKLQVGPMEIWAAGDFEGLQWRAMEDFAKDVEELLKRAHQRNPAAIKILVGPNPTLTDAQPAKAVLLSDPQGFKFCRQMDTLLRSVCEKMKEVAYVSVVDDTPSEISHREDSYKGAHLGQIMNQMVSRSVYVALLRKLSFRHVHNAHISRPVGHHQLHSAEEQNYIINVLEEDPASYAKAPTMVVK